MKRNLLTVSFFALFLIQGCSNEGGGLLDRFLKGTSSAIPVTVESVTAIERSQNLKVPAELEVETVDVSLSEDTIVEKVFSNEGETVTAGDPLFKISEQEISIKLAKLRNDLKDEQATLDKNNYLLRNRDRLLEEGKIDRSQYDGFDNEVQLNEATIEKKQAEISRLEERLANPIVTTPITGIVSKINAAPGISVPANRTIMTITRADPITLSFKLQSLNASAVKPGMIVKAKILDFLGEPIPARIVSVGTELDPGDSSFSVKAQIANPGIRLKAGMKAEVEFPTQEKQRFLVIPEEALIKEQRAFFVFLVVNGVAHKIQVIPNESIGNRIEISRGLKEGDIVVVKGNDKLNEGTVVDIWGR